MADGRACIICLDTSPPPIQSGCACRGDSGLAHIACLVRAAASQQAQRGSDAWRQWGTSLARWLPLHDKCRAALSLRLSRQTRIEHCR